MAKVLSELPDMARPGHQEQYPWTDWFDGQAWLLESGIDFQSATISMRSNAYAAARRHGKKIALRTIGSNLALQCLPIV